MPPKDSLDSNFATWVKTFLKNLTADVNLERARLAAAGGKDYKTTTVALQWCFARLGVKMRFHAQGGQAIVYLESTQTGATWARSGDSFDEALWEALSDVGASRAYERGELSS